MARRPGLKRPSGPGWTGAAALALLGAALGAAAVAALLMPTRLAPPPPPPQLAAPHLPPRPMPLPPPQPPAAPPPPPALRVALDPNGRGDPPATFAQVGYLRPAAAAPAPDGAPPGVLPLYGEPSASRRGRWSYYTLAPGHGVKVAVRDPRGRDCMDELGCDELHSGDRVTAPDAAGGALEVERYRPPPLRF